MARFPHGLQDLGGGLFAWLQPDGQWGLSNAGLITDQGDSLLVDTLFDRAHTARMLDAMRDATAAAASIDTVVNTHANGDHCYGNVLVKDAEIVASKACAEEMAGFPPARLAMLMRVASSVARLPGGPALGRTLARIGLGTVGGLLEAAPFVAEIFGDFDFSNTDEALPTRTFEGELELTVGDLRVLVQEVGPAHTQGDVLVHVPDRRSVFTGDILFIDAHPIIWEGPIANWRKACDALLAMDVDHIVPGHGPLTDHAGVQRVADYLDYLVERGTQCFETGLGLEAAAFELGRGAFTTWGERERLYVNLHTLYRELGGDVGPADPIRMFAGMARVRS